VSLADISGWIGAVLVVGAYAAVTLGFSWRPAALHTVNLVGSAGLAAVAVAHHAWPSVSVNVIWLAIAGVAIARLKAGHRQDSTIDKRGSGPAPERRWAGEGAAADSARSKSGSAVCASESARSGLIVVGER
jgi:hypothetical protein